MLEDTLVMLDTNIFDMLLNNDEFLTKLPRNGFKYYATDIQYQQICDIPEEKLEKRNKMKAIFFKIIDEKIPPISNQWFNFSNNFNNMRFCSNEEWSDFKDLRRDKKSIKDALILLTAKFGGNMIIVSEDKDFPFNEARKKGYRVYSLEGFLKCYNT